MKQIMKHVVMGTLLMALVFLMIPASVALASKGTQDGSNIELNDPSKDEWNSIYNTWDNEFSKVKGVTYDKKTNTLTLSKYVNPNAELRLNDMGDDFKIKISGTNELKSIEANSGGWGCSIEVSGTGTLTVNKNREMDTAIRIYGKCISNSLKVKEGAVLKVYKRNDENPSIQVEGKNKNTISIAGMADSAFRVEGPWAQRENVSVVAPATCMESTFVEGEGDTNQYVAVRDGDGYSLFRKTTETVKDYPVYENAYIWRNADEMAGLVKEDATMEAVLLDYDVWDVDLFAKPEEKGYDGLYYNWDKEYFAFCKLTEIPNTGWILATDFEQIDNPDSVPNEEFQIVGDNYGTQYWGDLSTLGKAGISKKTAKKNGLTVNWKAVSGAKGYQVRYSTSSKMTNAWYQDLASSKKSVTIDNLKSNVKIYVQVRAVSTDANGGKNYGAWSSAVNVKTK